MQVFSCYCLCKRDFGEEVVAGGRLRIAEVIEDVCGGLKKAIQSYRLRLHSGLRQSGRRLRRCFLGTAEAVPLSNAHGFA
jgi:hypothetical protein